MFPTDIWLEPSTDKRQKSEPIDYHCLFLSNVMEKKLLNSIVDKVTFD